MHVHLRSVATRIFVLAGMGLAGTVFGHAVTYWVAHPHAAERAHRLAASGHGYWGFGLTLAAYAALAALLGEFVIAHAGTKGMRPSRTRPPQTTFAQAWFRLGLVQAGLFAIIEVVERIASGGVNPEVWAEPAFVISIPVQVAVAALGVLLLSASRKTGERLAQSAGPSSPRLEPGWPLVVVARFTPSSPAETASRPRAPPAPAAT
jgi:hypothetical protein